MEGNCLTDDAPIGFKELRAKHLGLGFGGLLRCAKDIVTLLRLEGEREGIEGSVVTTQWRET